MNLLFRTLIKVFFKISMNWLVLFSITRRYYTRALTEEGGHRSAFQPISGKMSWVSSYSPSTVH